MVRDLVDIIEEQDSREEQENQENEILSDEFDFENFNMFDLENDLVYESNKTKEY